MDYTFQCGASADMDENIKGVFDRCADLEPNDHLTVFDFGENGDLRLDIYKDEDFNRETDEFDLVTVHTSQNHDGSMEYVDDTEDTYVGEELFRELERIYSYKEFGLL